MNKTHINDKALHVAAKELRKHGLGKFLAQRVAYVAIARYLAHTALQCDLKDIHDFNPEEPHAQ